MIERKDGAPGVSGGRGVEGERRESLDRRTGPDRRRPSGTTAIAPPTAVRPVSRVPARGSGAILGYGDTGPHAPLFRELARLELTEAEAQRHWRAIVRHRAQLLQHLGRDVGQRVALADYFLNIRPGLADMAIVDAAVLEASERTAIMDELTCLFNRQYLDVALARELQRCYRHKVTLSVLLLDVDDLKTINDHSGRPAGDEALRRLGEMIRKAFRAVDLPGRFAGDEFAILLPDTSRQRAFAAAERVRSDIAWFFQRHPVGGRPSAVTVSGGISSYPGDSSAADSLLGAAERALYAAKQAGRNCISL